MVYVLSNELFMTNYNPLVSICIPVFNREKLILETVEVIRKQSYKNIEIIILDNNSEDSTFEIIRKKYKDISNISLFKNDVNIGERASMNRLIDIANGELIAIFHSDDIYNQNIIKESVNAFNNFPTIAMTSSYGQKINQAGIVIDEYKIPNTLIKNTVVLFDDLFKAILRQDNVIMSPSVVVRKDIYKELGTFSLDEGIARAADYELWLRISEKYPIKLINQKLMDWREHEAQLSNESMRQYEQIPHMIKVYEQFNEKYKKKYSKYLNKYTIKKLFYHSVKLNSLNEFKKSDNILYFLKSYKNCVDNFTFYDKVKIGLLTFMNKFLIRINFELIKAFRNFFKSQ